MYSKEDILNAKFNKAVIGGYVMEEVDNFLDELAEYVREQETENTQLRENLYWAFSAAADKDEEIERLKKELAELEYKADKLAGRLRYCEERLLRSDKTMDYISYPSLSPLAIEDMERAYEN